MAEQDDDPKPTLDSDRAAILERRKRFIALALTGLSTAACTPGSSPAKPEVCLKGTPRQEEKDDYQGVEAPAPHPCLSVPIQSDPPPDPPQLPDPQVCLKIAMPPADAETDTGTDGEAGPPEPAPRPCLRKAAPKPCLKIANPE